MERFPEHWLWEPLDGSRCFLGVPYFEQKTITTTPSSSSNTTTTATTTTVTIYHCLLCETGQMNSEKVCIAHVNGKKHQKRYRLLNTQQNNFYREYQIPDNIRLEFVAEDILENNNNLSYLLPFRRWQYGAW